MKQATRKYFEEEQAQERAMLRHIAAAKESRSHYQQTGLHLTHEEFSSGVDQLQKNRKQRHQHLLPKKIRSVFSLS